jgi:hydrogen peroxide-dependent heme synthase
MGLSPGCHGAATARGDTGDCLTPNRGSVDAPGNKAGRICLYTDGVPLTPTTGWGVLHLFCRLTPDFDMNALRKAVSAAEADGYQVVPVALLGHKADLGLMALGPDVWRLRRLQTDVVGSGLVVAESYVSLTEVSEYAAGVPEEMRQARLFPTLPPAGKDAFCFYPMSKRRGDAHNWYSLDFESRKELMMGHGKVGRTFHGRVLQVITGSTGLDDYEWRRLRVGRDVVRCPSRRPEGVRL